MSFTENCETLIKQTHTRPVGTLEFKLTKSRETFHFSPPIQIKGNSMIALTSLEVYNSIFNITGENNKFELYKFPDSKNGGVLSEKVRNEIERDLYISDNTATQWQDEKIAPFFIEEYREQVTKRMKDDGCRRFLAIYVCSILQDFETFLRTKVDLVEDDIRLVLDENILGVITYQIESGKYTFKDISEALFKILQPEYELFNNSVDIKFHEFTMKTKLVVRLGSMAIWFDGKPFFSAVLGFNHGWDYKHYNEYISQIIVNLSTTNKIHLKCDCINGSILDGCRQQYFLVLF